MHTSLTPRTNVLLLLLNGAVIGASFAISPSPLIIVLAPFALAGLLAGTLQSRAVATAPATFCAAESWAAVRKALLSSHHGRLSLGLLWCNGVAVLCLILFGGRLATMATVLSAYASFMFFRELATFRSVLALSSSEPKL